MDVAANLFRRLLDPDRGESAVSLLAVDQPIRFIAGSLAGHESSEALVQDSSDLKAGFLRNTDPSSHDRVGQTVSIRIRFSEPVPVSHKVLRNEVLQVNNGTARMLKRVNGSNQPGEVHAELAFNAAVILTLPKITDCCVSDVVCTADRKTVSAPGSVTVPGSACAQTPTPTPTRDLVAPPTPPTDQFLNLPSAHDENATFPVELRFIKAVAAGHQKVRDHVLTVMEGQEISAQPHRPRQ